MKLFFLLGSIFFTFQIFASNQEDYDTNERLIEQLFADSDDDNNDIPLPTAEEPWPRVTAQKRKADSQHPDSPAKKKHRHEEDEVAQTKHPAAQKAPRYLHLIESGRMTLAQLEQYCAYHQKTDEPHHEDDEDSLEYNADSYPCLWSGCSGTNIFATNEALHDHLSTIHGRPSQRGTDQRFHCSFGTCTKSYTVKDNLINHINTHSGKRIVCPDCGHQFKNEAILKTHKKKQHDHREENIFTCHDCGKNIIGKNNLDRHINAVHKDIRRFPCTFDGCGQAFKTKIHLQEHFITHTQERLSCPHCTCTFSQRSALDVHVKDKHSQDSPLTYACDLCPRSFSSHSNLARHIKSAHPFEHQGDQ